jgi:hypothetical protein
MNAEYQNKLTKIGGKKRKSKKTKTKTKLRKLRKGGAIPIYTPSVSYPEAGTGNNTLGSINKQVTQNLMQGEANSQYDKMARTPTTTATLKGGLKKKYKKNNKSKKRTNK